MYPVYQRFLADREEFVEPVDRLLDGAHRSTTVEQFLSKALLIGVLTAGLTSMLGLLGGWAVTEYVLPPSPVFLGLSLSEPWLGIVNAIKLPGLIAMITILSGSVGFLTGFGVLLLLLQLEVSRRRREIDMLLPDAVAYMYALSTGGMRHLDVIEALADSEEVYGEVAREFETLLQETRYFDSDYRTAIRIRASETPSDRLGEFLTDLLSILNSGGDVTQFLDDRTALMMRDAKKRQESNLETLELFGEMYLTVSMMPLLLIILLVTMAITGSAGSLLLSVTVYVLIPFIGISFLLIIATVKQDELGDGLIYTDNDELTGLVAPDTPTSRRITKSFKSRKTADIFTTAYRRESLHRAKRILSNPNRLFVERPAASMAVTVPIAALAVGLLVDGGAVPTNWVGLIQRPVWGTFVYVYLPLYVICVPLAVFDVIHQRRQAAVINSLSESLRKLSSANDTGMFLLDSFKNVAETSTGRLSNEFAKIYRMVKYGATTEEAMVAFNNKYRIPRMARTVKLIAEAQKASSHISEVLRTAAKASENHDELEQERTNKSQTQIAVIVITFLLLLAVMALLKTQFVDVIGQLAEETSGSAAGSASGDSPLSASINTDRTSLLFFHAVIIQSASAAFISGYLSETRILAGIKYLVVLATLCLLVWIPL